jgi:hypothetical protein
MTKPSLVDMTLVRCSTADKFSSEIVAFFDKAIEEDEPNKYSCRLAKDFVICLNASHKELVTAMIRYFKTNSKTYFASKDISLSETNANAVSTTWVNLLKNQKNAIDRVKLATRIEQIKLSSVLKTLKKYVTKTEMDNALVRQPQNKKTQRPSALKVPQLPLPISKDTDDETSREAISPPKTVVDGIFCYGSGLFN